ncbi:MAG: hypothetical protein HDS91_01975 [Bacteroidales bacterium]|nr:hypothetical protein [Bacteroidales bacterium]
MDPDKTQDYYTHDGEQDAAASEGRKIDFSATDRVTDASSSAGSGRPAPRPRHRMRKFLLWVGFIVVVGLAAAVYIRYFNPYVTDARVKGYITSVERRGIIFKTFEGEMITEQALADTIRVYSRDFTFTIPDEAMAMELQQYQGTGRPVTITFSRYYGMLPWRGASTAVLTAIDNQ